MARNGELNIILELHVQHCPRAWGKLFPAMQTIKQIFSLLLELRHFIIVFLFCRIQLGSAPCYNISACSVWRLFPCHHSFSVGKGEQLLGIKSSSSKPALTLVKKGDGWSVDFNGKYSSKYPSKVPWYQPFSLSLFLFYGSSAITHISSGSSLDGRFSQGMNPNVLGEMKNIKKRKKVEPDSLQWHGKVWGVSLL